MRLKLQSTMFILITALWETEGRASGHAIKCPFPYLGNWTKLHSMLEQIKQRFRLRDCFKLFKLPGNVIWNLAKESSTLIIYICRSTGCKSSAMHSLYI
jgi:hypothetical protein